MYGGVKLGGEVCRELWAFDVSAKSWENITVKAEPCLPNSTSLCGMCLLEPASTIKTIFTVYGTVCKAETMIVFWRMRRWTGALMIAIDYRNWRCAIRSVTVSSIPMIA